MVYDKSKEWVLYLTRNETLFGSSIWHEIYSSDYLKEIMGLNLKDVLLIENQRNVTSMFRIKNQNDAYLNKIKNLAVNKQDYCISLLKEGIKLVEQAKQYLEKGPDSFKDFNEALAFYIKLFHHTTPLPFWIYNHSDELNIDNKEMLSLCEELRAESLYPLMQKKILKPIIIKALADKGLSNPEAASSVITYKEFLNDDFSKVDERIKQVKEGKLFVFQRLDGIETVNYIDDTKEILNKLSDSDSDEIKGQTACKGKVKGTVRLALTNDTRIEFNDGDVLVAFSTSPVLMPLIKKCSAIITDEGGIGCHAAIISRELGIPCIIGTKNATTALKDGDFVEVDADKGVVRIIE